MIVNMKMNVLIVDDDKVMLRVVDGFLKKIGFPNIIQASDGTIALRFLQDGPIGLVISDWNMETMTGLQLVKEMRASGKLKTIPFIMVTSEGSPDHVASAKEAGVNNYIVKPFNADTLRQKLVAVLGPF